MDLVGLIRSMALSFSLSTKDKDMSLEAYTQLLSYAFVYTKLHVYMSSSMHIHVAICSYM